MLRHKSPLLLFLIPLILMLSACSTVKPSLNAERPSDLTFRTDLKNELSSISVPVEATSDEVAKALNKLVRKDLYKGSTKTKGLSADVVRNGPISVSAADNFLYFSVPVSLSLNYGMFDTPALPVVLKFRASARVSPDWQLVTEVRYLGLGNLFAEELGIGPLSFKPRSIVDGLTLPLQQMVSDQINRNVNQIFPLKTRVAKAWEAAQKPILVEKNYSAWLKLSPREVTLFPLTARDNKVSLSVGVTTAVQLVVGPEPAAAPPLPLPPLKLVNSIDRNFRIALGAEIFYKDLVNAAAPMLLNKEFTSDGKSIVLKNFELYGNGDKFVIKVETQGALDGVLYLTGKPHFDTRTNVFSVEDVDFDLKTESLLLQSADWFLHSTIKSRIQEKLNMDLSQRMEHSRELAGKAIAQRQLLDHVILKGNIRTLKFSDVLVQKDKISIQVYAEGESAIVLQ